MDHLSASFIRNSWCFFLKLLWFLAFWFFPLQANFLQDFEIKNFKTFLLFGKMLEQIDDYTERTGVEDLDVENPNSFEGHPRAEFKVEDVDIFTQELLKLNGFILFFLLLTTIAFEFQASLLICFYALTGSTLAIIIVTIARKFYKKVLFKKESIRHSLMQQIGNIGFFFFGVFLAFWEVKSGSGFCSMKQVTMVLRDFLGIGVYVIVALIPVLATQSVHFGFLLVVSQKRQKVQFQQENPNKPAPTLQCGLMETFLVFWKAFIIGQSIMVSLRADLLIEWSWVQVLWISWLYIALLFGLTFGLFVLIVSRIYAKYILENVPFYESTFPNAHSINSP